MSNISTSSCINLSGDRFFIFICVNYSNLLKPQYILKQIFNPHLCQTYQQASIYQEADFHRCQIYQLPQASTILSHYINRQIFSFSSLSQIYSSSSLDILRKIFFLFISASIFQEADFFIFIWAVYAILAMFPPMSLWQFGVENVVLEMVSDSSLCDVLC